MFNREAFSTEAVIRHGNESFKAEVDNLSLKGLFVKTDRQIDLNEEVDVTMFFQGDKAHLSFSLKANVVRITEEGLGLNFRKIDVNSLMHSGGGLMEEFADETDALGSDEEIQARA